MARPKRKRKDFDTIKWNPLPTSTLPTNNIKHLGDDIVHLVEWREVYPRTTSTSTCAVTGQMLQNPRSVGSRMGCDMIITVCILCLVIAFAALTINEED